MTKMDKRAEDREALERLLEIYGADRTRWPARERLRFAGVISEDKAAAQHAGRGGRARPAAGSGAARERRRHRRAEGAHRGGGAADRSAPQLAVVAGGKAAAASSPARRVRRSPQVRASANGRRRRCSPPRWCSASMLGSTGTFDTTIQEVARGRRLRQRHRHPTARSSRWATTSTARSTRTCYDATRLSRRGSSPRTLRWALMARWRSTC